MVLGRGWLGVRLFLVGRARGHRRVARVRVRVVHGPARVVRVLVQAGRVLARMDRVRGHRRVGRVPVVGVARSRRSGLVRRRG
ncbi:hypothetical protein B0T36_25540, partial [Nocardia donostiensis]|uniref:hypothetical protein n=1 Tax=Nocardia donostiensis TaxID=1538463 RepID=UPI0009F13E4D